MDVVVWQGFQQRWRTLTPRLAGLGSRVVPVGRRPQVVAGPGVEEGEATQVAVHRRLRLGGLRAAQVAVQARFHDELVPDLHDGAPGAWHGGVEVPVEIPDGLGPHDVAVLAGFTWRVEGPEGRPDAVAPTRWALQLVRAPGEAGDTLTLQVEVSHSDVVDADRPGRWGHVVEAWVQVLRPVAGTLDVGRASRLRTPARRLLPVSAAPSPAGETTLTGITGLGFVLPTPRARDRRALMELALCVQERRTAARRYEAAARTAEGAGAGWLDVVELCPVAAGALADSATTAAAERALVS